MKDYIEAINEKKGYSDYNFKILRNKDGNFSLINDSGQLFRAEMNAKYIDSFNYAGIIYKDEYVLSIFVDIISNRKRFYSFIQFEMPSYTSSDILELDYYISQWTSDCYINGNILFMMQGDTVSVYDIKKYTAGNNFLIVGEKKKNSFKIFKDIGVMSIFKDGFHILTKEGKILQTDVDIEILHQFEENGTASVKLSDGTYAYMCEDGKLINIKHKNIFGINKPLDDVFDEVGDFDEYGLAKVHVKGKGWNYLLDDGTYLCKNFYYKLCGFNEYGIAEVTEDGSFDKNFINDDGDVLYSDGFDTVSNFKDGIARVNRDGEYNFVKEDGTLLSKKWYYLAKDFENGFGEVMDNKGFHNFINKDGKLISKVWFESIRNFNENGLGCAKDENGWHKIDSNGNLID